MATVIWQGGAAAVQQESRATPANVEVDDIFTLIIDDHDAVVFVATAATVANVVAGLKAAWDVAQPLQPEFDEIDATDQTTYLELKAKTAFAGVPFTVTATAVDGGGLDTQTLTMSTPTAATGPNHYDEPDNWSGGAIPVNSDAVIFQNSAVGCWYGLAQSGVTLASLHLDQSFTGTLGLARTNVFGGAGKEYAEYRQAYLATSATDVFIGLGDGTGSGRIKLDTGTNATAVNIWNSGTAAEAAAGIPAILWKGVHASNDVTANKGSVGIAFFGGETAQIDELRVGFDADQANDSNVQCGIGLTLATLEQDGGRLELNNDVTTGECRGGILEVAQAAAVGTLTLQDATCFYRSTGTLTAGILRGNGILDLRRDTRARTVAALDMYKSSSYFDPAGSSSLSSGIRVMHANLSEVTIVYKRGQKWTPSAT